MEPAERKVPGDGFAGAFFFLDDAVVSHPSGPPSSRSSSAAVGKPAGIWPVPAARAVGDRAGAAGARRRRGLPESRGAGLRRSLAQRPRARASSPSGVCASSSGWGLFTKAGGKVVEAFSAQAFILARRSPVSNLSL